MRALILLLSAVAFGCGQGDADRDEVEPVWLDDACGTDDPGYASPSDDALVAIERTNCYRNLMGIEQGRLDSRLDQAAQAHADYMATNGLITHTEDAASPGFTGENAWDRADAAGYTGWQGIMEVVSYGVGPAAAIDLWMDSVYHRVPFTLPAWDAAGFGYAGSYAAMTFAFPFPGDREDVVAYPVDGLQDVPPAFDSDTESPDPAPALGTVGYPVTVTVGTTSGTWSSNPYDLTLESGTLTGPDGEVAALPMDPAGDATLTFTATLLPEQPLQPETAYDAELVVVWSGGRRTVDVTFTTGQCAQAR